MLGRNHSRLRSRLVALGLPVLVVAAGLLVTSAAPATADGEPLRLVVTIEVFDDNGDGQLDLGDSYVVHYAVENLSGVDLTEFVVFNLVQLVDGTADCPITALPAGASTSCVSARVQIQQVELDAQQIYTAAAAGGLDANDNEYFSNIVEITEPIAGSASLHLDKTAVLHDVNGNGYTDVGDTIGYSFAVTNTGAGSVHNVAVDDPLAGAVSCDVQTLAPGEVTACTADAPYVLTEAVLGVLNGGDVVNTATATGLNSLDWPVASNEASTSTPTRPLDKITFDKSGNPPVDENGDDVLDAGDTIDYNFEIANDGSRRVVEFSIFDDLVPTYDCDRTRIEVGEVAQCHSNPPYVITQADIDAGVVTNTASAFGLTWEGGGADSNSDTTTTILLNGPALQLDKTGILTDQNGDGYRDAGDTIAYTLTVTNLSAVTVHAIAVDDPLAGSVSCVSTTLASGESTTCAADNAYVVTNSDLLAGEVENLATALGQDPDGDPVASDVARHLQPLDLVEQLTLRKHAAAPIDVNGDGLRDVGDTIAYTFDLTNTGSATLHSLTVSDPLAGPVTCPNGPLAAGESVTCTADNPYIVGQADVDAGQVTNTAVGSAIGPSGPVQSGPDSTTTPLDQVPSIAIDKQVAAINDGNGNGRVDAGDVIDYAFVVTNTGQSTLGSVGVDDALVAAVTCPVASLPPAASTTCTASYTVTQGDVEAGSVDNTATSHGSPPLGPDVTSALDSTHTPTSTLSALVLDKSAAAPVDVNGDGEVDAGDTIAYSFLVTNTGDVRLNGIVVDDDQLIGAVGCPATDLAPAESTTCMAGYTITQADVDAGSLVNIATATGTPRTGPDVTSPPDSTTTPTSQSAGLSLDKAVDSVDDVNGNQLVDTGDVVHYTFQVTNTGVVSLDTVAIDDPLIGAVSCPTARLAPTESTICTGSYVVTQADTDAGSVDNTATATAMPPSGQPVESAPDSTIVPTDQLAALRLDKIAGTPVDVDGDGLVDAGDTIAYSFVVTNTGDITVQTVTVDDPLAGSVSCDLTTLAPGEVAHCTADVDHVITQAEVDAEAVTNTAVAHGVSPQAVPVTSNPDSTTTPTDSRAGLRLAKRVGHVADANHDGVVDSGDQVRYVFTVTNTGTVRVDQLAIDDRMLAHAGVEVHCPVNALVPGGSTTCRSGPYALTKHDQSAGVVVNVARAHGHSLLQPSVTSDEARARLRLTEPPPVHHGGGGDLPDTGSHVSVWVPLGGMLMVLAGLTILMSRRRRR